MSFLRASVLVGAVLLLPGCLSTAQRAAITGDFSQVVKEGTAQGGIETLSAGDTYNLCTALLAVRSFGPLEKCLVALRKKVAADNGDLRVILPGLLGPSEGVYAAEWAKGEILELELHGAFYAGLYEESAVLADRLIQHTESTVYDTDWSRDAKFAWYTTLDEDDEVDSIRQYRLRHAIQAHGIKGYVGALRGDDDAVDRAIRAIRSFDVGGFDAQRALDAQQLWLTRIYFAVEDYDAAYAAIVEYDVVTLTEAVAGFARAFNFINPVAISVFGPQLGTIDTGALTFASEFEFEFVRYRAALEIGKHDEARSGFDGILSEPKVRGYGSVYWRALYGRALIHLNDGETGLAIEKLKRAVDVLEEQRGTLPTETGRLAFVADKQDVYNALVDALIRGGADLEAFQYAERAKARALVDLLASRDTFKGADAGSSQEQLSELAALELQSVQVASAQSVTETVRSARISELKAQISRNAPETASLVSVVPPDASAMMAALAPDETLIEYFGGDASLFAFVVRPSGVQAFRLKTPKLTQTVRLFRRAVQSPGSDRHERETRKMYDRIVRPLEAALPKTGILTVVPHGALHYLPFAALNDGSGYLIDRYQLRLLPSASVLQFLRTPQDIGQGLLALGNPDLGDPTLDLPGAEEETRVINQGWEQAQILLRDVATEANFKRYAPTFPYLHLASHGEFNSDEPLQSRMLLASGDGEDGNLTADELYGMRLSANMIVLSACETGLGTVSNGDDVIGLTRGFLYAGASSIVSSLWPVADDATAYLMKAFYEALKEMPRADALQKAMLLTKQKYPNPLYWSAFNLTGAV